MDVFNHLKISHNEYLLHEVEALEGIRTLSDGTNKPLLIKGVNKSNGVLGEFIVKFNSAERMTPAARCYEYVGACIAKELDLTPAEPVVIEITHEFVEQSIGFDWWELASKSVGINYGCYYSSGGWNFVAGEKLSKNQHRMAHGIFAFDVFTLNTDRRKEKQNMLTDGHNILIFDHELAFGFIVELSIFKDQTLLSKTSSTPPATTAAATAFAWRPITGST